MCKYVVLQGYPTDPIKDVRLEDASVPKSSDNLQVYYAAVDQREDGKYLTGSRAIALVGIGATLAEAERTAELAAVLIGGPVTHRKDIGTSGLIKQRVEHMHSVMTNN